MPNATAKKDDFWMQQALCEARRAAERGEVPVGAVVVRDSRLLARAHNLRESRGDPLAHAELLALGQAARLIPGWRLKGCTLYVTLEPCAMCAGALVNSRLDRLVFGAFDPKAGYCGSLGNLVQQPELNHQLELRAGVLATESSLLLKEFFVSLRSS